MTPATAIWIMVIAIVAMTFVFAKISRPPRV
jgi:hypothetical protein